jgi:hypothetical protein
MRHKNLDDLVSWILDLEQRYDVASWSIAGIPIWNIIRVRLYMDHFKINNEDLMLHKSGSTGIIKRAWLFVYDLFYSIRYCLIWPRKVNFIFSGVSVHRIYQEGFQFNRFFDPFMDFVEEQHGKSTVILESQPSKRKVSKYYKSKRVIELFRISNISYRIRKTLGIFKRKVKLYKLSGYEVFLNEVVENGFERRKHDLPFYQEQIEKILNYSDVYSIFFKKFRPDAVVSLCYYVNPLYGMNYAAKQLAITSVEMQHGTQGDLHVAYSKFTKMPISGYPTMPDVFWCWDDDSRNSINDWAMKTGLYRAFTGGNTWIDFNKRSISKVAYKVPDDIILLSLQPLSKILDDFIIEAIKKSESKLKWWIRLHPRQTEKIDEIKSWFASMGLEKVEIERSTHFPLSVLLEKAIIHITSSSAVVLEALLFDVPSIVTDSLGESLYSSQIDQGKVFKFNVKTGDMLLNKIDELTSVKTKRKKIDAVNWQTVLHEIDKK